MQLVAVNHAHHSRITKRTFCNGPSARSWFSPVYSSAFCFKEWLSSPLPNPKSNQAFILASVILIKTVIIEKANPKNCCRWCGALLCPALHAVAQGTEMGHAPTASVLTPCPSLLICYYRQEKETVKESWEAPCTPGLRWCKAWERCSSPAGPVTALTREPKSHRGGFLLFVSLACFLHRDYRSPSPPAPAVPASCPAILRSYGYGILLPIVPAISNLSALRRARERRKKKKKALFLHCVAKIYWK